VFSAVIWQIYFHLGAFSQFAAKKNLSIMHGYNVLHRAQAHT
jgi:hypothetical protein